MNKQRLKNDILLVLFLLILCIVLWGILQLTKKNGTEAEISLDGEIITVLPLNRDTEMTVTDPKGGVNVIKVEAGQIQVIEADCPDHICINQGKITFRGESIVCLPHKMVITIRGGKTEIDAFSN